MGLIAAQGISPSQLWMQLVLTLLILAVFAALAYLAVRFLKPRMAADNHGSRMQLVSTLSLGPKKNIYLVRVDNRELVLGVSDNQMMLLSETRIPEDSSAEDSSAEDSSDD